MHLLVSRLFILFLMIGIADAVRGTSHHADNNRKLLPTYPGLSPIVDETGAITLSIDGGEDHIQVEKPSAKATVRKAVLLWASRSDHSDGVKLMDVIVTPEGHAYEEYSQFHNYHADVTGIIQSKVDNADRGIHNLTVSIGNSTDGVILAVVFDDPAQTTENRATLLFGYADPSCDYFNFQLSRCLDEATLANPHLVLDMSLGISSSEDKPGIVSQVSINLYTIAASAGGNDDGNTITVGGIGDSNANPTERLKRSPDDELYDLIPFMKAGDCEIRVSKCTYSRYSRASPDVNLFFAALFVALPSQSKHSDAPSIDLVASDSPSDAPSLIPSQFPSNLPSAGLSEASAMISSDSPSDVPSLTPSQSPSQVEDTSDYPSLIPSQSPTESQAERRDGHAKSLQSTADTGVLPATSSRIVPVTLLLFLL